MKRMSRMKIVLAMPRGHASYRELTCTSTAITLPQTHRLMRSFHTGKKQNRVNMNQRAFATLQ
jgi:hypothetical protein